MVCGSQFITICSSPFWPPDVNSVHCVQKHRVIDCLETVRRKLLIVVYFMLVSFHQSTALGLNISQKNVSFSFSESTIHTAVIWTVHLGENLQLRNRCRLVWISPVIWNETITNDLHYISHGFSLGRTSALDIVWATHFFPKCLIRTS